MDAITPKVIHSYAGGTVDAQGNVVSSYEGGNGPEYQWYYPILYPFILLWYLAVVGFGLFDPSIPDGFISLYSAELVYFYLLAAVIALLVRTTASRVGSYFGGTTQSKKFRNN